MLCTAGVPVFVEPGRGGGCELLDSYSTDLTGLQISEMQALSRLAVPEPLALPGFSEALKAARDRPLSLGGAVEVLEPLPLRLALQDFAQPIAIRYGKG